MGGDGTSGEAKSPDDGGVKTLKLQGERRCVRVKVVPRFLPLGGSVDCYKVVDDGDCVDVVIEGKMADLPTLTRTAHINHYIWIAGGFKTEKKIEDGTLIVHTPAIKSSFPKKEIDFMSSYQVAKKIQSDSINSVCLELGKLGCVLDPQGFIEMLKKEDEDAARNKGKEKEAKKRKGKEMLNLDEAAAEGKEEDEDEASAAAAGNKGKEKEAKKRKGKGKEAKERKHRI